MGALPLATARDRDALVVCVRDPFPTATETLERATGRPVMLAVAVEVALLPLIAATYPVAYDSVPDEIDVDLDTGPVLAPAVGPEADALDPALLQLVDLDDRRVSKDHSQVGVRIPSRTRVLALDAALVTIAAAERGDQVVDALLAFLRYRFAAGVLFVCKDGLALGQAGFGNDVVGDAAPSLVVPLAQPSVLRLAHDEAASFVGAPTAETASTIQDRFFALFGAPPPKVIVVPVSIEGRVTNLLYAHGPRFASHEEAVIEVGTLAEAAEEAFVRIIGGAPPPG
jgi:hypothetical protein